MIGQEGIKEVYKNLSPHLTHLSLRDMLVLEPDSLIQALTKTPNLLSLNLSSNPIGDKTIQKIAEILPSHLKILELSQTMVSEVGARALAKHMPVHLSELRLTGGNLGAKGIASIAPKLPSSLDTLYLSHASLDKEESINFIKNLPKGLSDLDVRGMDFSSEALAFLPEKIWSIYMRGRILSSGIRQNVLWPEDLRELLLSYSNDSSPLGLLSNLPCCLYQLELPDTAHLNEMKDLKDQPGHFAFSDGSFTPMIIENWADVVLIVRFNPAKSFRIPPSKALKKLRWIVLSNVHLNNEAVLDFLSHLSPDVWYLDLSSTDLTLDALPQFIERLPKNLRRLNLRGIDFGEKGLALLKAYKAKREAKDGILFNLITD